jgi:hypothetical protein
MIRTCHILVAFIISLSSNSAFAQEWTIEEPTIEYQGLQLIVDYTISSWLKEDDVIISIFRDEDFMEPIENKNGFLEPAVVVDGSSGVQKVRLKTCV